MLHAGFSSGDRAGARQQAGIELVRGFRLLSNNQTRFGKFEVGKATISGKDVVVPLKIWGDERGYRMEKDPPRREALAYWARIHLTDVGQGLQIKDIEFPAREVRGVDGDIFRTKAHWIRATLEDIADGK